MAIEGLFDQAMLGIFKRAKDEANYTASIFHQMLSRDGGVKTAKALINATTPSDGYTPLYLRGRLDLTVEAVVIEEPRWHSLFTKDELDRAHRRLTQYEYVSHKI